MAKFTPDFTARTVLVTGAARGIGWALAHGFSEAGALTYAIDVDLDEITQSTSGTDLRAVAADVTGSEQVARCVEQIVAETGRIDVLVNNAGILRDGVLWKLTDDDWDRVLAVHAGGTFRMTAPVCRPSGNTATAGSSTSPPTPDCMAMSERRTTPRRRRASSASPRPRRRSSPASVQCHRQRGVPRCRDADGHRDP